MKELVSIQDLIIVPVLLAVIFLYTNYISNKHIEDKPYYRYFKWGLWVKITAGFAFAMVYIFYYGGGDTLYYYWGTKSIVKLFSKDFLTALGIIFGDHSLEAYSAFDRGTGWPTYWRDVNSFAVCRFNLIFYLLGFGSFLGNTLVMNFLLFFGLWRFYQMLVSLYPGKEKWMAYAVFFIPSVVFWSSGILKDGWTLSGMLIILSSLYQFIVLKRKKWLNIFYIVFWGYVVFRIRPFMLYATLGAGSLWLILNYARSIQSKFLTIVALPIIILIIGSGAYLVFRQLGAVAGDRYDDVGSMLETAWIIQDDLKKDYYGGNTFDIGTFEPTIPGVLKMAPKAINAGLFRPYLWEAKTPFMLLSGLENLVLVFLTLYSIFKGGLIKTLRKDYFLLSILTLSLMLAFSMGLTTANFGSLVRYVIPVTLFYGVVIVQATIPFNSYERKKVKGKR